MATVLERNGSYCHMFQEAQARTSDVIANALNFSKRKTEERPAV